MHVDVGRLRSPPRDSTLPPSYLKFSAITCCELLRVGAAVMDGDDRLRLEDVVEVLGVGLALVDCRCRRCGRSRHIRACGRTRSAPARCGEVPMLVMPAFHRIGAPGVAALEQAGPITITMFGLAASLVAAVWPPSALQSESSALNLMRMADELAADVLDRDLDRALLIECRARCRRPTAPNSRRSGSARPLESPRRRCRR